MIEKDDPARRAGETKREPGHRVANTQRLLTESAGPQFEWRCRPTVFGCLGDQGYEMRPRSNNRMFLIWRGTAHAVVRLVKGPRLWQLKRSRNRPVLWAPAAKIAAILQPLGILWPVLDENTLSWPARAFAD